jgi:hypothetical protein
MNLFSLAIASYITFISRVFIVPRAILFYCDRFVFDHSHAGLILTSRSSQHYSSMAVSLHSSHPISSHGKQTQNKTEKIFICLINLHHNTKLTSINQFSVLFFHIITQIYLIFFSFTHPPTNHTFRIGDPTCFG